ncbi:MarR family winged helix-turn-helix transcriptional regulator [Lachnospiraceae bacterium NSJ-143]|nr:MarR family winged helix-turn-helix transcriptional regulator [Lachnospiraceae bacterium NSJ-143]
MAQLYKSNCYCTNLRRSANAISDFYDTALKEAGLTISQYYLLVNLSRLGTANITHWAEHVGLNRSTMVRNIKLLQSRNLIDAVEGHGKTFALSSNGKEVLDMAMPLWQEAQTRIETLLGSDDIETLFRISEKIQTVNEK